MRQGDSSLPTALQSYENAFCSQALECEAAPESQHQIPSGELLLSCLFLCTQAREVSDRLCRV